MDDLEEWRDIPSFEGQYQASTEGRIKSLERVLIRSNGNPQTIKGRILKPNLRKMGKSKRVVPSVNLRLDGRLVTYRIHSLVLTTFVGAKPLGLECCHRDDDSVNNRISNLYWGTRSQNSFDAVRNGRNYLANRETCDEGHLFDQANTGYRTDHYGRYCKTCLHTRGAQKRLAHATI